MFLLPPFSPWAFKALNTAPLRRLDLIAVDLLGHAAIILGALTIPTLQHLRVIFCQFGSNFALTEFLSRHNAISTFEIIFRPGSAYQFPRTILPALVSLKTNPIDIENLLSHTGVFPKLDHVCVVIHLSRHNQFIFADVENSLARAAKRLTMANIRLCLDVLPTSRYETSVNLGPFPCNLKNFPVLSRVREIAFGFPHPDALPTTTIPTWLSLFPLLEHIEITNVPIRLSIDAKMALLRLIAQKCVGIQTVKRLATIRQICLFGSPTVNLNGLSYNPSLIAVY